MQPVQFDHGAQEGRETAQRVAAIDDTAGVLPDAPDWPEWLNYVRGNAVEDEISD